MTSNVVSFPPRDPSFAAVGAKRLAAISAYRAGCVEIAAKAVEQALLATVEILGAEEIGINDAFPLFVEAMRQELKKFAPSRLERAGGHGARRFYRRQLRESKESAGHCDDMASP